MLSPLDHIADGKASPLSSRIARYVGVSYSTLSLFVGIFDVLLVVFIEGTVGANTVSILCKGFYIDP